MRQMDSAFDADLALAKRLADAAASISMRYFQRELRQWPKPDGSLVTEADIAVENELRQQLRVYRPDDAVLGEEQGQTGASSRRWILDAIDGTIDFADGKVGWGTLIALEADGEVVVAVCDAPERKRRYWAMRERGAFCSDNNGAERRLAVSATSHLRNARSYIPPAQYQPDEQARRMAALLATGTNPIDPSDHPALQVAAGGYEVAVFFTGGPWDVAAPSLIVKEAGGRFTDLAGRNDLMSGTGVFSNGHLHGATLKLISAT
jgi:histidinol-phosphatase